MGLDLIILSLNELQEHKGFARLDFFAALVEKESYMSASSIKFNDKRKLFKIKYLFNLNIKFVISVHLHSIFKTTTYCRNKSDKPTNDVKIKYLKTN